MDSELQTDNDKYYRDELVLIEIENPTFETPEEIFPMAEEDLTRINRYIVTGEEEDQVVHDWTKIYYHRIWDEPHSQIEFMIRTLKEGLPTGECQISMWDKSVDQDAEKSPCTQILWARIKHGKLEWHTHAHSSDAYKKLLMNIREFIALQHYVAGRLGVEVGRYYHFLDSCHIHWKDLELAQDLYQKLPSSS
jgi:thymidylate synthase